MEKFAGAKDRGVSLTLGDDSQVILFEDSDGNTVIRRYPPAPDMKDLPPDFSPELLPPMPSAPGVECVEFKFKKTT